MILFLRYRRKRRDRDDGAGDNRPRTAGSYNSMEDRVYEDKKDMPTLSAGTETTKFGILTPDYHSSRYDGPGVALGDPGGGKSSIEKPRAQPLTRLGLSRQPSGEAISTNYVRTSSLKNRKPVLISDPPPARPKTPQEGGNKKDNAKDGSGSSGTVNGGWSIFPKADPDPKGLTATTAQPPLPSAAANLQNWLSAAAVSPFGPLDSKSGPGVASGPSATVKGAPAPKRLTATKWPLQDDNPKEGTDPSAYGTSGAKPDIAVVKQNAAEKSVEVKGTGLPTGPAAGKKSAA